MKFVLLTIAVFAFIGFGSKVYADEDMNKFLEFLKEVFKDCQTKNAISETDIEKFMSGEFDEGGANKEVMCHINCMMEGFGVLEGGNKKALEYLKSSIDEEKAEEIYQECQHESGVDKCETGYNVYMCLKANSQDMLHKK